MPRSFTRFGLLAASAAVLMFCATAQAQRQRQVVPEKQEQEKAQEAREGSRVGDKLPNFTAKNAMTGESFSLKDLRGQIVLVDFWATWCPPCIAELPNVKKTYAKYHDKGFEIVSISLDRDGDSNKCKSFAEREGMDWIHVIEGGFWDARLAKQYNIQAIPAMFILDAEGVVVSDNARGKELARAIEKAMKKTPPRPMAGVMLTKAQDLLASKKYAAAMDAFEAIVKKQSGSEAASAAEKHIQEMQADKDIARIIEEARAERSRAERQKKTGNWFTMARSLAKAQNYKSARKYFQRIIDNYPDSDDADIAKRELEELPK